MTDPTVLIADLLVVNGLITHVYSAHDRVTTQSIRRQLDTAASTMRKIRRALRAEIAQLVLAQNSDDSSKDDDDDDETLLRTKRRRQEAPESKTAPSLSSRLAPTCRNCNSGRHEMGSLLCPKQDLTEQERKQFEGWFAVRCHKTGDGEVAIRRVDLKNFCTQARRRNLSYNVKEFLTHDDAIAFVNYGWTSGEAQSNTSKHAVANDDEVADIVRSVDELVADAVNRLQDDDGGKTTGVIELSDETDAGEEETSDNE